MTRGRAARSRLAGSRSRERRLPSPSSLSSSKLRDSRRWPKSKIRVSSALVHVTSSSWAQPGVRRSDHSKLLLVLMNRSHKSLGPTPEPSAIGAIRCCRPRPSGNGSGQRWAPNLCLASEHGGSGAPTITAQSFPRRAASEPDGTTSRHATRGPGWLGAPHRKGCVSSRLRSERPDVPGLHVAPASFLQRRCEDWPCVDRAEHNHRDRRYRQAAMARCHRCRVSSRRITGW